VGFRDRGEVAICILPGIPPCWKVKWFIAPMRTLFYDGCDGPRTARRRSSRSLRGGDRPIGRVLVFFSAADCRSHLAEAGAVGPGPRPFRAVCRAIDCEGHPSMRFDGPADFVAALGASCKGEGRLAESRTTGQTWGSDISAKGNWFEHGRANPGKTGRLGLYCLKYPGGPKRGLAGSANAVDPLSQEKRFENLWPLAGLVETCQRVLFFFWRIGN